MREQLRENQAARRVRYGLAHRALRRFFRFETFGRFIGAYLCVNATFLAAEALTTPLVPEWLPSWSASGPPPASDLKAIMLNVSSYLLGAQIGLLGVISLALALVTLIAQREGSSTDVQVYYHESFSFELVASCLALAAVQSMQLLWPFQFMLHRAGLGTDLQIFKLGLLNLHLVWLLVNLGAVAYFIATTFRFVQPSARETLRERYTANVVLPLDLTLRLRQQLYRSAAAALVNENRDERGGPSAAFGFDFGNPQIIEVKMAFKRSVVLHDVRVRWVRWVLRRWAARCEETAIHDPAAATQGLELQGPRIWFTLHLDEPLRGEVGWCRRRGGVPLNSLEKFILRHAFRFRINRNER